MSHVTDIIITCSIMEDNDQEDVFPAIDFINNYLESRNRGKLNNLGGNEGGTKCWQTNVFGAAFNNLDLEEFAAALKSAPWHEPENVTILIQDEHDEAMREVRLIKDAPYNTIAEKLQNLLTDELEAEFID